MTLGQRRIQVPSEPVTGSIICDPLLVHCLNKFSQLSFFSYKVCPIIACNVPQSSLDGYHLRLHLHLHVIRSVKSLDVTPTVKIRKQTNAFRISVVLNEPAISKCTALVAEPVNRHKYLIAENLRVVLVVKGPA